jgi:hypothetical protein
MLPATVLGFKTGDPGLRPQLIRRLFGIFRTETLIHERRGTVHLAVLAVDRAMARIRLHLGLKQLHFVAGNLPVDIKVNQFDEAVVFHG